MATVPSSSSPPSLSSASNYDNSAIQPAFHSSTSPKPQADAGDSNVEDIKPESPSPFPELYTASFSELYTASYTEKFKKYETDYTRRLMSKYFSKKNLYGGNIYDENLTIGDETIKSSRWPCTRSYADPAQGFEDQSSSSLTGTAETLSNISNGKLSVKKNG